MLLLRRAWASVCTGDQLPAAAVEVWSLPSGSADSSCVRQLADRYAAYWASWLDTLLAFRARSSQIAASCARSPHPMPAVQ